MHSILPIKSFNSKSNSNSVNRKYTAKKTVLIKTFHGVFNIVPVEITTGLSSTSDLDLTKSPWCAAEFSCFLKCREAPASAESCWLQARESSNRLFSFITVRHSPHLLLGESVIYCMFSTDIFSPSDDIWCALWILWIYII